MTPCTSNLHLAPKNVYSPLTDVSPNSLILYVSPTPSPTKIHSPPTPSNPSLSPNPSPMTIFAFCMSVLNQNHWISLVISADRNDSSLHVSHAYRRNSKENQKPSGSSAGSAVGSKSRKKLALLSPGGLYDETYAKARKVLKYVVLEFLLFFSNLSFGLIQCPVLVFRSLLSRIRLLIGRVAFFLILHGLYMKFISSAVCLYIFLRFS